MNAYRKIILIMGLVVLISGCSPNEANGIDNIPPTHTPVENISNQLDCIYPERVQGSLTMQGSLVELEGKSNNLEVWNLDMEQKIVLGRVQILSGVATNYQRIAYIDADKHQVKIVSSDGKVLFEHSAPNNWVEILDWPASEHLLISNMPFRQDESWYPPSSTISLDINSDKYIELLPEYPNIYTYTSGAPSFGDYSYSLTAYDPTLTYVVYPADTLNSSYVALWDILNHREIVRLQMSFPFGAIRWKKDGASFIISAPPRFKDWQGNEYRNVFDDLPYVGGNELFLVDRNGTIKRLTYWTTKYEMDESALAWSPNNENIAFWLKLGTDNPEWQLAILNVETGETRSFCTGGEEGSLPIIWSPDGKQVISTISQNDYINHEMLLIDIQKNQSRIWPLETRIVVGWLDTGK
jgi:WD40 repeat protein